MATAYSNTARILHRTLRAKASFTCQIGVRISSSSALATFETAISPMRAKGVPLEARRPLVGLPRMVPACALLFHHLHGVVGRGSPGAESSSGCGSAVRRGTSRCRPRVCPAGPRARTRPRGPCRDGGPLVWSSGAERGFALTQCPPQGLDSSAMMEAHHCPARAACFDAGHQTTEPVPHQHPSLRQRAVPA